MRFVIMRRVESYLLQINTTTDDNNNNNNNNNHNNNTIIEIIMIITLHANILHLNSSFISDEMYQDRYNILTRLVFS